MMYGPPSRNSGAENTKTSVGGPIQGGWRRDGRLWGPIVCWSGVSTKNPSRRLRHDVGHNCKALLVGPVPVTQIVCFTGHDPYRRAPRSFSRDERAYPCLQK
jgi:hypothetical protein